MASDPRRPYFAPAPTGRHELPTPGKVRPNYPEGLEMHAGELAEPFPIVTLSTDVLTAARTMGDPRRRDDPALARVYDERASEKLMTKLSSRTVRDLLPEPQDRDALPVVEPDATILEVAALMARMHSPLVAVVDGGRVLGAVTLSRLFEVLFPEQTDAS